MCKMRSIFRVISPSAKKILWKTSNSDGVWRISVYDDTMMSRVGYELTSTMTLPWTIAMLDYKWSLHKKFTKRTCSSENVSFDVPKILD